jgi:hypothetical protein
MKLKIVKGIIFITIGILFLFVTFYNYHSYAIINDREFSFYEYLVIFRDYDLNHFFRETIFNYIFAILFMGLGVLEIIDSGILKKAGDDNAY